VISVGSEELGEILSSMTRIEMKVVTFLYFHSPCFSIKLRKWGFSPGTLSNLLSRLEKKGLVEVVKNPLTGKWIVIALTDKGKKVAELLIYLSHRIK